MSLALVFLLLRSAAADPPRDLFWVPTSLLALNTTGLFYSFASSNFSATESAVKNTYAATAMRFYRMDCGINPLQTVTPGEATVFNLRVNGANTTLTCSVDGSSTTGTCSVTVANPVVVNQTSGAAFNQLTVQGVNSGTLENNSSATCFVLTQYLFAPGGP